MTLTEESIRKISTIRLFICLKDKIGKWLSAALEDPKVCKEMKDDINDLFDLMEELNIFVEKRDPPWTPVEDEDVFVLQNGYLGIGKVRTVHDTGINVLINGMIRDFPPHLVKKLDMSKNGKPWSELP